MAAIGPFAVRPMLGVKGKQGGNWSRGKRATVFQARGVSDLGRCKTGAHAIFPVQQGGVAVACGRRIARVENSKRERIDDILPVTEHTVPLEHHH